MAEAWQVLQFGPEWVGLFSRRQKIEASRYAAEVARNVEMYSGVLAKRGGTRFVSARRTACNAGWTTTTGTVADATGFAAGDTVFLLNPDGQYAEAILSSVAPFGTLTVSAPLVFAPQAGCSVVVRRPLSGWRVIASSPTFVQVYATGTTPVVPGEAGVTVLDRVIAGQTLWVLNTDGTLGTGVVGGAVLDTITWATAPAFTPAVGAQVFTRVDGLFQASFRNGTRKVLGAAGAALWDAEGDPTVLTPQFPFVTVTGGGLAFVGPVGTGTVDSVETLLVGQRVSLRGTGPSGLGTFTGTITAVTTATLTIAITFGSTPPSTVSATTRVFLVPGREPGDTVFAQYANVTHIVGPGMVPVKYTGSVVQRHGIQPPTNATGMTAIPGGAGNLTGQYRYRVRFRNPTTGQESEAGLVAANGVITSPATSLAITTVPNPAAQLVNLANIPVSPDPQVTMKRLYRTLSGGDGIWYYLAEITNATTVYVDNTADTGLGPVMRDLVDDPIPDSVEIVSVWPQANRLVGIDVDLQAVVYSDAFDLDEGFFKAESWPTDNLIFVSYDDGDPIRGLAALFGSIFVFKERSVWRIEGVPPDLTISPVMYRYDLTGAGALSHKGILVDQDEALFASQDGMYALSRQSQAEGFESRRLSSAIDLEWERLSINQRTLVHGVYYRRRRQVRLWMPVDAATEPSLGFIYQLEGSADSRPSGWSLWDVARNQAAMKITASAILQGQGDVVHIGTDRGEVLAMDTGTADADVYPFWFDYTTTPFAPGGMGRPCRGRAVDTVVVPLASGTVTLEVRFDFGVRSVSKVLPIATVGGFILDISRLDVDTLGGVRPQLVNRTTLGRGEYHQVRFSEFSNTAAFWLQGFNYWMQVLAAQALDRRAG